jgi:hypothetical protein
MLLCPADRLKEQYEVEHPYPWIRASAQIAWAPTQYQYYLWGW